MSIKTKPISEVAAKWSEVTPGRSRYYEAGVRNPREDWGSQTQASGPIYQQAVQAGDIGRRYSGGVRRAGTQKWQRKAIEVGIPRFGPGVIAAKGDFEAGFAPMLETIAAVTLPARAPRGSEQNLERVRAVTTALAAKRLALRAAGG